MLVVLLLSAILLTTWPLEADAIIPQDARDVARNLFDHYLFAFEVIGVLLLAAVIGGLYLARRDPDMPATNQPVVPSVEPDA